MLSGIPPVGIEGPEIEISEPVHGPAGLAGQDRLLLLLAGREEGGGKGVHHGDNGNRQDQEGHDDFEERKAPRIMDEMIIAKTPIVS